MTTPCNSKTITEELWQNAQLSGVCSPNNVSPITSKGHGLYILAQDGSSYADLRMSTERPFWGHSHPLTVQNNYDQLAQINSNNYFSSSSELYSFLGSHQKITFDQLGSLALTDEYSYLLELTDKDFIQHSRSDIFESLINSSLSDKVWVHHNNTTLSTQGELFFEELNSELLGESYGLLFSPDVFLVNRPISSNSNSALLSAFTNYIDKILVNKTHGKFALNQSILDEFILSNDIRLERKFNFLVYRNVSHVDYGPFREAGIIITHSNYIDNDLYFSIPVACTTRELLDTLNRIVLVLKGQPCLF